jgi:CheY-like chemotaxis protein
LNNAAQYAGDGNTGDKVWLCVAREEDSAVVSVRDAGVGIAREMLPKIFDMFTRVEDSNGQSSGGLGIGLSLAKRLVEMHGGSIEVGSNGLGTGSTFTVRLPVSVAGPPAEASDTRTSTNSAPTSFKRRILFADDNRDVVESFEMMLRILGHDVLTALDGVEALEKAEEHRPDVIVLDVGMPRLDGYETARRIRQMPWSRDVILIAVTGWGNDNDKRVSAEAGFNIHLVKPVDATMILDVIEQMGQPSTAS